MLKSKIQVIEELTEMPIYTIQSSSLIGELSDEQKHIFSKALIRVAGSIGRIGSQRATLTFRGDSNTNLSYKLSHEETTLSEDMIFDLYFYFGDKAKHFYKRDDEAVKNSICMTSIEDYCNQTFEFIYEEICKAFKSKGREIVDYKKSNPDFAAFFNGKNKDIFISCMSQPHYGRDYYYFFLHTLGWRPFSELSFLVSTSHDYNEVAATFGLGGDKQYITYYLIAEPFEHFAVTHTKIKKYESVLKDNGLPLYNGKSIHPNENEVAVKGALLPSFIFGVRDVSENRFIANPHLFTEMNRNRSIAHGLYIDQSDFDLKLRNTNYKRGTETFLDGHYRTIQRKSS